MVTAVLAARRLPRRGRRARPGGKPVPRLAIERVLPRSDVEDVTEGALAPPWMTILHNCECHTFDQVVRQLQKAIACTEAAGWEIAWQVHNTGKAVVKVGPETECVRVGNILASIGLVVTVVQS
jgi:hypothetical protein